MLDRLRQSLALRLAVPYALVFALGAAALFAELYYLLGNALEHRDQAAIEKRAQVLADGYEFGGPALLRTRLENDTSPDARSFFVRLINPDGSAGFLVYPQDWIETEVRQLPIPGYALKREVVRFPQNDIRDYTIAQFGLTDGRVLQVGRLTESRAALLAPLRRAFLVVGAGALVLSAGIGLLLAWRATHPLRQLGDTVRRILETGELDARVPPSERRDELATLARQLNTLLDKNAAHVRVLRETLDNLAHDLRTPLTRLRGTAELALHDTGDPAEVKGALADCVNESDRLLHLLETLLDVSAAEAGALKLNRDRLDLRSLVDRAVDLYREVAEERRIQVIVDQPNAVEWDADSIRLGQAVNNLVDNALKYTPAGGRVTITTRLEAGAATITVADNGPGVPEHERGAIFRRLYRGDASRSQRGLGLGLSLVKAMVESHGGTVTVSSVPGGGAAFTIRLPQVSASQIV
jgi:signal transduction histidine kinase